MNYDKQRPLKGKNYTFAKFMGGFFLNYIVLLLFIALSSLLPYSCWVHEDYLNYAVMGLIVTTGFIVFIQDWMSGPQKIYSNHIGITDGDDIVEVRRWPNKIQNAYITGISFKQQKFDPQIWSINNVNTKELIISNHLYGLKAWSEMVVRFINSFGTEILESAVNEFTDEITDVVSQVTDEISLPNCINDDMLDTFAEKFGSGLIDFVDEVANRDGTLAQNFKSQLANVKHKGMGMLSVIIADIVTDLIPDTLDNYSPSIDIVIKKIIESVMEIISAKIQNKGITVVLQQQANALKDDEEFQEIMNELKNEREQIEFGAGKLVQITNIATGGKFNDYIEKVITVVQDEMSKGISTIANGGSVGDVFKGMIDVGKELIISIIREEISKSLKNQLIKNTQVILEWIPEEIAANENDLKQFIDVLIEQLATSAINIFNANFDGVSVDFIEQIRQNKNKQDYMRQIALKKGEIIRNVIKQEMGRLKRVLQDYLKDECDKYIEIYKQKLLEILNTATGGQFVEYIKQSLDVLQSGVIFNSHNCNAENKVISPVDDFDSTVRYMAN